MDFIKKTSITFWRTSKIASIGILLTLFIIIYSFFIYIFASNKPINGEKRSNFDKIVINEKEFEDEIKKDYNLSHFDVLVTSGRINFDLEIKELIYNESSKKIFYEILNKYQEKNNWKIKVPISDELKKYEVSGVIDYKSSSQTYPLIISKKKQEQEFNWVNKNGDRTTDFTKKDSE